MVKVPDGVRTPVDEWRLIPTLGQKPCPVTVTTVPVGPWVGLREIEGETYALEQTANTGATKRVLESARMTARATEIDEYFVLVNSFLSNPRVI